MKRCSKCGAAPATHKLVFYYGDRSGMIAPGMCQPCTYEDLKTSVIISKYADYVKMRPLHWWEKL